MLALAPRLAGLVPSVECDQELVEPARLDSAAGVGIRLAAPVRLDAWLIDRDLAVERVGRCVVCFDSVGSTNDVAFASARAVSPSMSSTRKPR